ncbi:LamG domain-containing protein [Bellilinea sp.]|uniref:LamG domain-containing protein n=1 Tax=Bellilinea sp. TaxID=2838785 RepID=UPI002ADE2BB5|nr:LamG domain-containing protein [Bellilinea sp.]
MKYKFSKNSNNFVYFFIFLCGLIIIGFVQVPNNSFAEPVNYGLGFDGINDNVQLPLIYNVFGGDSWRNTKTISLWIKPEGPGEECGQPNPGHCQLIIGIIPRSWGISRGILNGEDRIWIWNIDDINEKPDAMIPLIYEPDEWIHIALVHDNNQLKAYRYGSHLPGDTRNSYASVSVDTAGEKVSYLTLGGFFKQDEKYAFKGQIDEVRVYNIGLDATAISQIYQELTPPFSPNLKAYYRMSDGDGSFLTDDSGQGNVGIFREELQTAVPPNGPQWVESGLFGSGPTPTLPPTFTVTATFTSTPSPTATPTRLPPGFTPQPSITPTRTLDPNTNNFLFLPMVRK